MSSKKRFVDLLRTRRSLVEHEPPRIVEPRDDEQVGRLVEPTQLLAICWKP
jgi:hypothetical protein